MRFSTDIAADKYAQAAALTGEERFKEALVIFDEIKDQVEDPSTEFKRHHAQCLQERLRYDESMALLSDILAGDADDTEALLIRTFCHGKQNKHAEAIADYERILELDGSFSKQIGYYAYLLERTGRLEDADQYYLKGLEAHPDDLWYLGHYAFYLHKVKRYDESADYFERTIAKNTKNTWAIKRYAYLKRDKDGLDAASAYYDQLIGDEPDNVNHYLNYAELLILGGKGDVAEPLLETALTLDKPLVLEVIAQFYMAFYYLSVKDYVAVNTHYSKIIELVKGVESYIHRDYTDIAGYVETNFDPQQTELYGLILSRASNLAKQK